MDNFQLATTKINNAIDVCSKNIERQIGYRDNYETRIWMINPEIEVRKLLDE